MPPYMQSFPMLQTLMQTTPVLVHGVQSSVDVGQHSPLNSWHRGSSVGVETQVAEVVVAMVVVVDDEVVDGVVEGVVVVVLDEVVDGVVVVLDEVVEAVVDEEVDDVVVLIVLEVVVEGLLVTFTFESALL